MKDSGTKRKPLILLIILTILALVLLAYIISALNKEDNNGQVNPSPSPTGAPTATSTPELTPTREPTSEPTPEPTPETIKATIVSAGDCVIHDKIRLAAKIDGEDSYDFTHMFEDIKPFVEKADYALISYEGAATNKRNDYSGYPIFNTPPEIFDAFRYAGFNLINNSNNHQLDRRVSGMLETRENIKKAGLEIIGAYDGEEPRYLIKDINGIKVGFMAYAYGSNGNEAALTSDQIYKHLALFDKPRMEKEIKELEEKADVTVIAMHWGHEYWTTPNDQQISMAKEMFEWGADVILGSHPHVIQPSEIHTVNGETKYVVYSMGNFLTNMLHEWYDDPKKEKWLQEDGTLISIEFTKDLTTEKTIISKIIHIPTWLSREKIDGDTIHRILPIPSRDYYKEGDLSDELLKKALESYDRTIGNFTDYEQE